jgi:DNA-binding response OmpR family regulator
MGAQGATSRTVLVVDDEPKIAEVVSSYLRRQGYTPLVAGTGGDGLRALEGSDPCLVILDLMLPDIPGEEVCRRIRAASRVPVIMLTAKATDGDAVRGLGLGADDYVTKPFSPRELMARVEAVLRRSSGEAAATARELRFDGGELVLDLDAAEVRRSGSVLDLTLREFRILSVLAGSPGKVFSREELITLALGDGFRGGDRTVDVHVKNLRRKVETDPRRPRWVLTVHGMGYRFRAGPGG